MSTTATLDFETQALNTLDACIRKMSKQLDADFDPLDKQSMSLFKQFCSALRTRTQWIKNIGKAVIEPIAQLVSPKTTKDEKKASSKRESPIINGLIEETQRYLAQTKNQNPKAGKKNGLLMKY